MAIYNDTLTEAVSALESVLSQKIISFTLSEAATAGDSVAKGVYNDSITSAVNANDSISLSATSTSSYAITESVSARDTLSPDTLSTYASYFLNAKSSVVQLELLEISHPNFTQTYRLVRNAINGVTVTLEDANVRTFNYYPLRIESLGTRDNLDYGIKIDLGDLGQVLPLELDAVAVANGYLTKPTVIYRTYRSDDLTKPLFGPLTLEVTNFSFNKDGASFEAKAPSLNLNRTGETYKLDRFPMLRGFL